MNKMNQKTLIKEDRIVPPAEAAYRLGISLGTLYKWEKEGKLPLRVVLSTRKTGWKESEIASFINNLKPIKLNNNNE